VRWIALALGVYALLVATVPTDRQGAAPPGPRPANWTRATLGSTVAETVKVLGRPVTSYEISSTGGTRTVIYDYGGWRAMFVNGRMAGKTP
jgi:hypothetical protein